LVMLLLFWDWKDNNNNNIGLGQVEEMRVSGTNTHERAYSILSFLLRFESSRAGHFLLLFYLSRASIT